MCALLDEFVSSVSRICSELGSESVRLAVRSLSSPYLRYDQMKSSLLRWPYDLTLTPFVVYVGLVVVSAAIWREGGAPMAAHRGTALRLPMGEVGFGCSVKPR